MLKKEEHLICVHITFHYNNKRLKILKKVCSDLLKISNKVYIFIHTNLVSRKKKILKSKKIKILYHSLKNQNPYFLSWRCRALMYKQKELFDVFIYMEDDINFKKKNFLYWLKNKNICIKESFNLGFLRVEKLGKNLLCSDQIKNVTHHTFINEKKFFILNNPYCGFWIYDRNEFLNFTKTKYWSFRWLYKTVSNVHLIREQSALGWNHEIMRRYKKTIVPSVRNVLDTSCYVPHLTNNYAKNPVGLFGVFKINELVNKKTFVYKYSLIYFLIENFKNYIYRLIRFNLKNFKKKLKILNC